MARIITKELAEKIADKLGAKMVWAKAHDMAHIYHGALLVAVFGIRRSSMKDTGHDYVPEAIHLTTGKAKRLGQCPMSKAQWIEEMMQKGIIPHPNDPDNQARNEPQTG